MTMSNPNAIKTEAQKSATHPIRDFVRAFSDAFGPVEYRAESADGKVIQTKNWRDTSHLKEFPQSLWGLK